MALSWLPQVEKQNSECFLKERPENSVTLSFVRLIDALFNFAFHFIEGKVAFTAAFHLFELFVYVELSR